MQKELFVETIEAIEKQLKHDIEFSKKISAAFPNASESNLLPDNHYLSNALMKVLQELTGDTTPDKYGLSWIEYYCFELEFGKNYKVGMVKDKAGNNIPLSNAGELYDFLVGKKTSR